MILYLHRFAIISKENIHQNVTYSKPEDNQPECHYQNQVHIYFTLTDPLHLKFHYHYHIIIKVFQYWSRF